MTVSSSRGKQKIKRADVYKKILKNYDEWHALMVLLEAEEKELHREFLRIIDKKKLEKVMRRIGDQKG